MNNFNHGWVWWFDDNEPDSMVYVNSGDSFDLESEVRSFVGSVVVAGGFADGNPETENIKRVMYQLNVEGEFHSAIRVEKADGQSGWLLVMRHEEKD